MADISSIRTAIKDTINGTGHFKNTFEYEPNRFGSLPSATVFFDGFNQNPRTKMDFSVRWRFIVRLYVALKDAEKAQRDMDTYIVDVIDRLRANDELNGTAYLSEVSSGDVFISVDKNTPHFMAEINVVAETHELEE